MFTAMDLSGILEAQKERELLVAALDQAAECIIITDTEGVTIYINSAYESLTGYGKSEMLGRVPDIFDSSVHDPYFYKNIIKTLRNGEVWQGPMELRNKSGTVFETETAISPVKDQMGTVTYFVAVQRDVSNERRLEAQLQQAQKMEAIGTLAGGIAHDFNNILGAINGYAELALAQVEPGDKLHEYLLQVQQGGDRAGRLVKQILTFSRQTGQEKTPLLLSKPVEEALSLLRASLPSTIAIHQDIVAEKLMVLADPTQLHQVLMNLCTNAAHAMGAKGGEIRISLKSAVPESSEGVSLAGNGPYACLTVSDTGPGMSPRILQRIFDPFFTTKKPGEGTGMGLAMVHGIVKSHGGEVAVSSLEGEGTTFKVYLPMLKDQPREIRETLPPIPRGSERVMLVDDELTLVEMTAQMLDSLGYEVLPHTSSVEALEAFKADPLGCDILLTDLTMPKLTGIDLAREVIDTRPDMPVIMCTGFSETGIREKAAFAGIKALLMKPLNRRSLAEEMRRALGDDPESGPNRV
jgi:PAS domain S-box-containing protein